MHDPGPRSLPRSLALVCVLWICCAIGIDVWIGFIEVPWLRVGAHAANRLSGGEFHPEVLEAHGRALGFAIAHLIAAWGMGTPLARLLLGARRRRMERWLTGTLLGLIGLGLLVFLAGMIGLWSRGAATAVLIVFSLQALICLWRERDGLKEDWRRFRREFRRADWAFLAPALLTGALLVLYALCPPVQSDAVRYHLAAPAEWIKAGRITYLPGSAFSNFPFLVEMNFSLALLVGAPEGSHLIHLTYLALAAGFAALMAGQLGGRWAAARETGAGSQYSRFNPRPGVIALALLITNPIAGPIGAWAFVDLGSLACLLAMIWALMRWADRPGPRGLSLAAIFAGGAFACKYTNLVPAAASALIVAVLEGRRAVAGTKWTKGIVAALRFGALAGLIAFPWLARNAANTGNPFYWLGYSIFGGPDWSEEQDAFFRDRSSQKGAATTILQQKILDRGYAGTAAEWQNALHETFPAKATRMILLPWNTYRWPGAFEENPLGPLILLAGPLALLLGLWGLSRRPPPSVWMSVFFAALLSGFWAVSYQSNRFLLPIIALLGVWLAVWSCAKTRAGLSRAALAAAVCVVISQVALTSQIILAFERTNALRYALGREGREDFLLRNLNYYEGARWLNKNVPAEEGVFLAGEHRTLYFQPRVIAADWFDTPAPLRLLRRSGSVDAMLDALLEEQIPWVFFNLAELFTGLPRTPGPENYLLQARSRGQEGELLRAYITRGPRAYLEPDAPPLGSGSYAYDYFRLRFTDDEWNQWVEFVFSPRLEVAYSPSPLLRVCRILPSGAR